MRELNGDDTFKISEIIDNMGIVLPAMTKIVDKKEVQKTEAELGYEIMSLVVAKIYKAKIPVCELLADLKETSPDNIRAMPFKALIEMVKELFSKAEIIDFFK
jgi:hypothetical protein